MVYCGILDATLGLFVSLVNHAVPVRHITQSLPCLLSAPADTFDIATQPSLSVPGVTVIPMPIVVALPPLSPPPPGFGPEQLQNLDKFSIYSLSVAFACSGLPSQAALGPLPTAPVIFCE